MTTKTLTVTHYEFDFVDWNGRTKTRRFTDLGEAKLAAARLHGDGTITTVTSELQVGDEVIVQAYARPRLGVVTKLGRTRATVRFARNRQGDIDERPFGAGEVWKS